ncbi:ribonuclease H-like domain-containing protein [Tanacetum coccineum]
MNRGANPNLKCNHCSKIGHTIDRFFEIVGFPQGFKRNPNTRKQTFNVNSDVKMNYNSASSSSSSFTLNQMQKLLNMISDKPSGSMHVNMVGRASFFNGNVWFNISFSKYFYANYSLFVTTITMGWIIDSGENQHLTVSTVWMFNIVDIFELKITVSHPNGTLATISHVGILKLCNNVVLYDVLIVLGYSVSLLSINKLIIDSKMFVDFDKGRKFWDWLGHPTDQVLFVLKKDLNISDNTFVPMCKVCQSAKQTREPFPLSDHKSKTLGELVHLDLWGPYKVYSREGIFYQSSCSHTPQQNRIAERKHRQLLNVARSCLHIPNDDGRDPSIVEGSLPHSDGLTTQGKTQGDGLTATQVDDQNCLNKSVEPTSLSEAMSDPNWVKAMNNEIKALNRNNTWNIYDLPAGRKPIGSKWIWKIKYKASGDIERYKARLVAKGFGPKEGFDYDETFTPVIKMVTVRCIIPIAHNGDKFIALIIYVDDIVITGNDDVGIKEFKRKYCLELLYEYGLLDAKRVDIPLLENSVLSFKETANDKLESIEISQSSSEAEYRSMSSASCEVVWLGNLLHSIGLKNLYPVELFAIQIAANPVFHERTKHFELDVHFVREKFSCLGMLDVFAGVLVGKALGRKRHFQRKKKEVHAHQPEGGC